MPPDQEHGEREHELPPGVPAGGPDISVDPAAAEAEALSLLRRTGDEIVAGVERLIPAWAVAEVARIVEAWGARDEVEREEVLLKAQRAGELASRRVVAELEALYALDPMEQRATPLQIIRSVYREVGQVLREAGIPPVERGRFAERSLPDDDYGVAPTTLADLGDDDLQALHLAWGVAKATVHKARRQTS